MDEVCSIFCYNNRISDIVIERHSLRTSKVINHSSTNLSSQMSMINEIHYIVRCLVAIELFIRAKRQMH